MYTTTCIFALVVFFESRFQWDREVPLEEGQAVDQDFLGLYRLVAGSEKGRVGLHHEVNGDAVTFTLCVVAESSSDIQLLGGSWRLDERWERHPMAFLTTEDQHELVAAFAQSFRLLGIRSEEQLVPTGQRTVFIAAFSHLALDALRREQTET